MAIKSIKLENKNGRVQSFGVEHGLNVLRLKKSAWKLPIDSQFELIQNGFRKKPSPGTIGEETKKKPTRKSKRS